MLVTHKTLIYASKSEPQYEIYLCRQYYKLVSNKYKLILDYDLYLRNIINYYQTILVSKRLSEVHIHSNSWNTVTHASNTQQKISTQYDIYLYGTY